jgi:hypothetical protein
VLILSIHKEEVQRILGSEIMKVVRYNQHKWAINNSEVLKMLTSVQAERLIQEIEVRNVKKEDVLGKRG